MQILYSERLVMSRGEGASFFSFFFVLAVILVLHLRETENRNCEFFFLFFLLLNHRFRRGVRVAAAVIDPPSTLRRQEIVGA